MSRKHRKKLGKTYGPTPEAPPTGPTVPKSTDPIERFVRATGEPPQDRGYINAPPETGLPIPGELLPCPWCGPQGSYLVIANGKIWLGMKYSEPVSWSVRHWCGVGNPTRMLERVGRDREAAVKAWNERWISDEYVG